MSVQTLNFDGEIYSVNLFTDELLAFLSGYVPYLVFDLEPDLQPFETLYIYHEVKEHETIEYDPVSCELLSLVSYVNGDLAFYILTLKPLDVDFDLLLKAENLARNLKDSKSIVKCNLLPSCQSH